VLTGKPSDSIRMVQRPIQMQAYRLYKRLEQHVPGHIIIRRTDNDLDAQNPNISSSDFYLLYLFIFIFFERQCIHSSSQKTAASKKDITQKIRAIIREEVAAPAECQFAHGKPAVLM